MAGGMLGVKAGRVMIWHCMQLPWFVLQIIQLLRSHVASASLHLSVLKMKLA